MKPSVPFLKPSPSGRQRLRKNRAKERDPEVYLTGIVKGLTASEPEEWLALAADRSALVTGYEFRRIYNAPSRTSSGAIELDFLFFTGGAQIPAQVDEEFFHAPARARAEARAKDLMLEKILRPRGARQVSRIRATLLTDIDAATWVLEQMIYGMVFTLDNQ